MFGDTLIRTFEISCSSFFIKQAFDFPADVSLSFGGPSASSVWVMEMHYDNPAMKPGKVRCRCVLYVCVHVALE